MNSHNIPYEKVGNNEPVSIADEVPFDIPESWEWCRLKSLGAPFDDAFADGPFGSNLKKEHYTEDREVRLIQLSNIGDEGWKDTNTKYTTYMHAQTLSRSMVKPGCIVIAKMMPAGRAIIVPNLEKDYILSSDAVKFIPNERLDVEYLLFAINSPAFRNQVVAEAHGVTRVRTSLGKLQTYYLPIPPLMEQKRIVQQIKSIHPLIKKYESRESKRLELDSLFPDLLKKSILQEAVIGKLVPQDKNDEPASVLLERIREEKHRLIAEGKLKRDKHESIIYRRDNSYYEKINGKEKCIDDEIPFEIPNSWEWVRLKNIVNVVSARRVHKTDWKTQGVPFYRAREIGKLSEQGYVDNDLYISEELFSELSKNGVPQKGDLMITAVGTLGKVYIVKDEDRFYYKDASVICLENYGKILPDYLKLVISSPFLVDLIKKKSTGTTVGTITISTANEYFIPVPPRKEQDRIIEKAKKITSWISTL